jgi:lysophospholipase L1-like esterase
MKRILKNALWIGFFTSCFASFQVRAQSPFYGEIQHFKRQDSAQFPPQNAILFVGSSSFRKWEDVQAYFPDKKIINRGFGGSELSDLIRYVNMIIIPYHPKQIVIYAGENDLAYSDTITPAIVLSRVKTLFTQIRSALPEVPIIYVSIKPSPSREKLMPEMEEANKMIKRFLLTKKKMVFIDVYHKMLDKNSKPMPGIFLEDNLHMNAIGYHIWQKAIAPYLIN